TGVGRRRSLPAARRACSLRAIARRTLGERPAFKAICEIVIVASPFAFLAAGFFAVVFFVVDIWSFLSIVALMRREQYHVGGVTRSYRMRCKRNFLPINFDYRIGLLALFYLREIFGFIERMEFVGNVEWLMAWFYLWEICGFT